MSEAQNGGNVMERLTYWNEEYGCWSYHCGSGEAANRLAAYEETGLTPEEIDMDHEAAEQLRHLCRNCDLDRLEIWPRPTRTVGWWCCRARWAINYTECFTEKSSSTELGA